ncbi:hypothetical protein [Weissella soli]|uniref:hypothetical protein n=1 Tax=Weissella soli TaxID=155866 RepID=UPI0011BB3093|nr:hypothetical protein [Weissella soli]QEA34507.1 hypothetical protein FGL88_01520 [Weissella soli]
MSKPFFISYDLHEPGQKYEDVRDTIKSFGGAYIKILESTWLVRNNLTPQQMSDKLANVVDPNDEFLVCELTNSYQGHLKKSDWEFIRKNILF